MAVLVITSTVVTVAMLLLLRKRFDAVSRHQYDRMRGALPDSRAVPEGGFPTPPLPGQASVVRDAVKEDARG